MYRNFQTDGKQTVCLGKWLEQNTETKIPKTLRLYLENVIHSN